MTSTDSLDPPLTGPPAWERDLVRRTSALLQAQVPLSLLLDLAAPGGPDSSAFYAAEPADACWLRRAG